MRRSDELCSVLTGIIHARVPATIWRRGAVRAALKRLRWSQSFRCTHFGEAHHCVLWVGARKGFRCGACHMVSLRNRARICLGMEHTMIFSDKFVWLHFPKCAGTKIEQLFAKYFSDDAGIAQDLVDPQAAKPIWHDSVAERAKRDANFILGNRIVICSFRRLPSWLESRYSFEVNRSPELDHRPELLLEGRFLEQKGNISHADKYVKYWLPEPMVNSGKVRFIRTECFASDFLSVFGQFVDLSAIPREELGTKANASQSLVPPEIREQLYGDGSPLRQHCPYWTKIERLVYGDLL